MCPAARDALHTPVAPPPASMETALLRLVRGQLDLAEGRPGAAAREAEAAARLLAEHYGLDHPGLLPWRTTAALAALQLGDRRRAQHLAAEALERARAVNVAAALGAALWLNGRVSIGEDAVALLSEAVDVLGATPARLEHASAMADLAVALRRTGRTQAGSVQLRRALELARQLQAGLLLTRTLGEMRALGQRPRRAAAGVDALTPAERRVAELARSGQSNRLIAQTLFVTVKTVETHLASVYRKLAITGRSELHAALAATVAPPAPDV